MKMNLVAVKLTETELRALDDMVKFKNFKTRSHVLRQALIQLFREHGIKSDALEDIKIERIVHPQRKGKQREAFRRRG